MLSSSFSLQEEISQGTVSPSLIQIQYTIEVSPTLSPARVVTSSYISTPHQYYYSYHHHQHHHHYNDRNKRHVYRRDTTTTSPSSLSSLSSSSTSTKSASRTIDNPDKCTGSKQECQRPTERNMGMVVGIATAIPVFVVIIIFSALFYIIYQRSKREALEDDFDPEFDGDAEFLPTTYVQVKPNPNSSSSAETTSQDMKEKFEQNFYASRGVVGGPQQYQQQQLPPTMLKMARAYSSNTLNTRSSINPFGNSATSGLTDQAWEMDAIRLPGNDDAESLKNFARKLQTESVGGYHVASASRNASQLSLTGGSQEQTRNLCGPDSMVKRSTLDMLNSPSKNNNNNNNNNNNSNNMNYMNTQADSGANNSSSAAGKNVDNSEINNSMLHEADMSFAGTMSNVPLLGRDTDQQQHTARPKSQFGEPNNEYKAYNLSEDGGVNEQDNRNNDGGDASEGEGEGEFEFEFEVSDRRMSTTIEQNASSATAPGLINDTESTGRVLRSDASLANDDPDSKIYSLKKGRPTTGLRDNSKRWSSGIGDEDIDDTEESEEEENIKRMRSIYNVYMDGTLETSSNLARRESKLSFTALHNSASGPGVASPSFQNSPLATTSPNRSPGSYIPDGEETTTRVTSDRRSSHHPTEISDNDTTRNTHSRTSDEIDTPNVNSNSNTPNKKSEGILASARNSNIKNASPRQRVRLDPGRSAGTLTSPGHRTRVTSQEGNSESSSLSVTQQKKMSRGSSYRPPSSIYSEAPGPLYFQQQNYQQHQLPSGYNMQHLQVQWNQNPQGQFYTRDYLPQEYYMQSVPYQRDHPQTLEEIGELPTPAKLVNSSSLHSLTSFRGPSKQQHGQQLQPASINGTALNPMDHPDMFYLSNTESSFSQDQQTRSSDSTSSLSKNGSGTSALLPFQLRTSVVMTNPAEVEANNSYRPAGSIRKFTDSNSRNNSFTTQTNPYQQMLDSRVSGILDPTDVIHPASMGNILPHSGSQEDLRKQLGTSDKYKII